MQAFITGATGFLGRHLVEKLLIEGWTITALVRRLDKAHEIFGHSITLKEGDLTHPESIKVAMPDRLDAVFHLGADTSTWHKHKKHQELVNMDGTHFLLQAILDKQVKRLVHVSSLSVFGHHTTPINEHAERRGVLSSIPYVRSKSYAERKVKEAVERGLDAVIVNPSHIMGHYDTHNWARLIIDMAKGTLPATPPGYGNFANARTVADAIIAAYKTGRAGENYILGGPYASFQTLLDIAAEKIGGISPPKRVSPYTLKGYAFLLAFIAAFTGSRPKVTKEEAYLASENIEAISDKAIKELGYKTVPLAETIQEVVEYLKETGTISQR